MESHSSLLGDLEKEDLGAFFERLSKNTGRTFMFTPDAASMIKQESQESRDRKRKREEITDAHEATETKHSKYTSSLPPKSSIPLDISYHGKSQARISNAVKSVGSISVDIDVNPTGIGEHFLLPNQPMTSLNCETPQPNISLIESFDSQSKPAQNSQDKIRSTATETIENISESVVANRRTKHSQKLYVYPQTRLTPVVTRQNSINDTSKNAKLRPAKFKEVGVASVISKQEGISYLTPPRSEIVGKVVTPKTSQPSGPSQRRANISTTSLSKKAVSKKKKDWRDEKVTPTEFVHLAIANARVASTKYLAGKVILFVSADSHLAGKSTKDMIEKIVKLGGTLVTEYDPDRLTHIVTNALNANNQAIRVSPRPVIKATGVKSLAEIPEHIHIVTTRWLSSGKLVHPSPISDGSRDTKGKGREDYLAAVPVMSDEEKEGYAVFPERLERPSHKPKKRASLSSGKASIVEIDSVASESPGSEVLVEEHVEAYPRLKQEAEPDEVFPIIDLDLVGDSDVEEFIKEDKRQPLENAWAYEKQTPGNVPNQDVVDKLMELKEIVSSKPGSDYLWRKYSYGRAARNIRKYPTRIRSLEEAMSIEGVAEPTARKVMEIIQTGDLQRINYEMNNSYLATQIFTNIYGVGQKIAHQWHAAGCRTLEDIRNRQGGITVTPAQEIGLRFYEDLLERMPREEVKAIFDLIKPVALSLDPRLYVECMGSYRRGQADCGDIDILLSRPTDDGKSHAGILQPLIAALHKAQIITEDLTIPDDTADEEGIYRGLCRLGPNGKRRRIDFLCVKWKSRGAALVYFTGDDIFNRSIRLKANKMGYSLNQRGIMSNIIRDRQNRQIKITKGKIVCGETEREIFDFLGVPWQEPHERIRQ